MRAVFLNENERRATGEHRHKRRGLEIGMERRHGREQAVVGRKVALPVAIVAAIEHVGVGKFNTLRVARGARGENDHSRIERVDVDRSRKLACLLGNFRVEVARRAEKPLVARVGDEQRRHMVRLSAKRTGNAAFHALAVVALAIGLGDNHRDVALLEHVHAFGKRMLHVDGHRHRAEFGARHAACDVLGAVVELHAHILAGGHADRAKKIRNAIDVCIEFGIGEIALRAIFAMKFKEGMRPPVSGEPFPHVSQILVSHNSCHALNLSPEFLVKIPSFKMWPARMRATSAITPR